MARAEIIIAAKKAADAWRNTDTYHQAAQIIDMLVSELEENPTLAQPNEPLTLDELREMDGEPVWVELYRAWALVEVKQNGSVMFYGNSFSCSYSRTWNVYRFRPREAAMEFC